MRQKQIQLTSFGRAVHATCNVIRPDTTSDLEHYMKQDPQPRVLARGNGLSYNDSNLSTEHTVINTERFNHFLDFDPLTGTLQCEGHITFQELLTIDQNYIPPVIPGTMRATIAGSIAHDVHGKNNHLAGSLGHHILWLDLLTHHGIIHCSPAKYPELFYATIAGAGLTGVIQRLAIQLKNSGRMVAVEHTRFESLAHLLAYMSADGLNHQYQVAWLDLLSMEPKGIVSVANPTKADSTSKQHEGNIPKLPFRIINKWDMTWFNKVYFKWKPQQQELDLMSFNNPLDSIKYWDRLYGRKGLVQFQAVFNQNQALKIMTHILHIIRRHDATPALSVLKLLIKPGLGYLSFCEPGFTIAIDFINNTKAHDAILELNDYITQMHGKVYLAKDLLLTKEQFQIMYPQYQEFQEILNDYHCGMSSNLSKRLGITVI